MKNNIFEIITSNFKKLSDEKVKAILLAEIQRRINLMSPVDALRFIFDIDKSLYNVEGNASIRYGNGIHTKHKHIKYHEFFTNNINNGERVLDIGCGNGYLTYDIAKKVKDGTVVGIDLIKENIDYALNNFARDNVIYIFGDVLKELPEMEFDVIVMSNFLEHIEKRVDFLKIIKKKYNPVKVLIRVPCFDRDWRVPLKKEIGIDYMLDNTHYIEYYYSDFKKEISEAKFNVETAQINWGEIWAVIKNN